MPDPRLKTYTPPSDFTTSRTRAPRWRRARSRPVRLRATCRPGAARPTLIFTGRYRRSGCGRGTSGCRTTPVSRPHRAAGWAFVEAAARRFIPDALGSAASDEAAYDCALLLIAHDADRGLDAGNGRRQLLADGAARLLSAYLGDLDELAGREFRDPGFLAWALIEYARIVEDRGLLASGPAASSSARLA